MNSFGRVRHIPTVFALRPRLQATFSRNRTYRLSAGSAFSGLTFALPGAVNSVTVDGNWPREIDTGSTHFVIYQPQVDTWKDNRIEARSAVIVTQRENPRQVFGIVSINARTEVDRETRLVSFEDITIKDAGIVNAIW